MVVDSIIWVRRRLVGKDHTHTCRHTDTQNQIRSLIYLARFTKSSWKWGPRETGADGLYHHWAFHCIWNPRPGAGSRSSYFRYKAGCGKPNLSPASQAVSLELNISMQETLHYPSTCVLIRECLECWALWLGSLHPPTHTLLPPENQSGDSWGVLSL